MAEAQQARVSNRAVVRCLRRVSTWVYAGLFLAVGMGVGRIASRLVGDESLLSTAVSVVVMWVPFVLLLRKRIQNEQRIAALEALGLACVRCGYDLRMRSSSQCPECGLVLENMDQKDPSPNVSR